MSAKISMQRGEEGGGKESRKEKKREGELGKEKQRGNRHREGKEGSKGERGAASTYMEVANGGIDEAYSVD